MNTKKRKKKCLKLMKRDGPNCFYCGKEVFEPTTNLIPRATLDHYVPRSLGGSNKLKNLRLSCAKCNSQKGGKMPDDLTPIQIKRLSKRNYKVPEKEAHDG